MNNLGQLINASESKGFTLEQLKEINDLFTRKDIQIEIYVSSLNQMKIQAAKIAICFWLNHLNGNTNNIFTNGIEVNSGVDEQPHNYEQTLTGAKNRLYNMKHLISNKIILNDNIARILISLENGLMTENLSDIDISNRKTFIIENNIVWVDRCVAAVEIIFNGKKWTCFGTSRGITIPKDAVKLSEKSNWVKTAGFYISKKYGGNSKDPHKTICGIPRQDILEEMIKNIFGVIY